MRHFYSILIVIFSILFVVAVLLKTDPHFFLNDDVLSQFLPEIKIQAETVFLYHEIPQINYYHYLGHPILPQGQFGTFYPPRYFFAWAAIHLGNFEYSVNFENVFHMILAGVGMYWFLINLKVRRLYSVIGAIAFSLNGLMIEVGRNWLMVSGYFAYMPYLYLVLIRDLKLGKKPIVSALIRVIIFSIGYTNFFVYICFFELLFFLLLRPTKKAVYTYIFSILITLVLILPLLIPIIRGLQGSSRSTNFYGRFYNSNNIFYLIKSFIQVPCLNWKYIICSPLKFSNALLIPVFIGGAYLVIRKKYVFDADFARHLRNTFNNLKKRVFYFRFLFMFLIGLLLLITGLGLLIDIVSFTLLLYIIKYKKKANSLYFWGFFCLLAIGLSFGIKSFSTIIFFPLIIFFRWPWKWYLVGQFVLTVFSVLFFQRFFSVKYKWILSFFAFVIVFIIFGSTTASFSYNTYFKPYDQLGNLSYLSQIDGRMIAVSFNPKEGMLSELLADNVGSYFHINTFAGYDPLVSVKKSKVVDLEHDHPVLMEDEDFYRMSNTLSEYGVSNYLVDKDSYSSNSFLNDVRFIKKYEDNRFLIFKDTKALPIVYDQSQKELQFKIKGNSLLVNLRDLPDTRNIAFNYFAEDENWNVYIDSKLQPFVKDDLNRIWVSIPGNSHIVELRYRDKGFYYGVWGMLFGLIILVPIYFGVYRKRIFTM